jgi:hypothetical protein
MNIRFSLVLLAVGVLGCGANANDNNNVGNPDASHASGGDAAPDANTQRDPATILQDPPTFPPATIANLQPTVSISVRNDTGVNNAFTLALSDPHFTIETTNCGTPVAPNAACTAQVKFIGGDPLTFYRGTLTARGTSTVAGFSPDVNFEMNVAVSGLVARALDVTVSDTMFPETATLADDSVVVITVKNLTGQTAQFTYGLAGDFQETNQINVVSTNCGFQFNTPHAGDVFSLAASQECELQLHYYEAEHETRARTFVETFNAHLVSNIPPFNATPQSVAIKLVEPDFRYFKKTGVAARFMENGDVVICAPTRVQRYDRLERLIWSRAVSCNMIETNKNDDILVYGSGRIRRLSPAGAVVWTAVSPDAIHAIALALDGGAAVSSTQLTRYSPTGSKLWTAIRPAEDHPTNLAIDAGGNVLTLTEPTAEELFLVTYSASGVRTESVDPVISQYAASMAIGDNNELLVFATGHEHSEINFAIGCTPGNRAWSFDPISSWPSSISSSHGLHALLEWEAEEEWRLCRKGLPEIVGGYGIAGARAYHAPSYVAGFDVAGDGRYLLYGSGSIVVSK